MCVPLCYPHAGVQDLFWCSIRVPTPPSPITDIGLKQVLASTLTDQSLDEGVLGRAYGSTRYHHASCTRIRSIYTATSPTPYTPISRTASCGRYCNHHWFPLSEAPKCLSRQPVRAVDGACCGRGSTDFSEAISSLEEQQTPPENCFFPQRSVRP